MQPQLQKGAFVFISSPMSTVPSDWLRDAVMIFKEVEGVTLIINADLAAAAPDIPLWAMVTLMVLFSDSTGTHTIFMEPACLQ